MKPDIPNATLVFRRDLNERYSILRVRPDARPIPAFVPGQFVNLGLPREAPARAGDDPAAAPRVRIDRRSYSIASSAREREHYELFLALVEGGRLTPELWNLVEGSRCWIDGRALGSFTLEGVPEDRDIVLIGTGTGIAPYVSMLRTHATEPPWNTITLVHGVRQVSDLGYREELETRAREDERFHYVPVVSREAWNGLRGRVQTALERERLEAVAGVTLDPARCFVFLCGNPGMIRDVRAQLAPLGFEPGTPDRPGNLRLEKYW